MTREMRRFGLDVGRRRTTPPQLRVGDPDGEFVTIALQEWYDVGARVDLVTRGLEGLPMEHPLVWMRRGGQLVAEDRDLAWLAASRAAYLAHGAVLQAFHVVTRHGWIDLISGHREAWPRVRHYQE